MLSETERHPHVAKRRDHLGRDGVQVIRDGGSENGLRAGFAGLFSAFTTAFVTMRSFTDVLAGHSRNRRLNFTKK
jgi:hypothetical protein